MKSGQYQYYNPAAQGKSKTIFSVSRNCGSLVWRDIYGQDDNGELHHCFRNKTIKLVYI